MKKLMTAALGLSLLSGSVVFAQDTTSTDTGSMKSSKKSKKHHKKSTDTTSTTSTTK